MRRLAALALLLAFSADADAGNGSNYVHLTNGIDYFFGKTPPAGNLVGIWRCFPSDMLHAPTLCLDPAQTASFNSYGTKVCAVHINVSASPGSTLRFPTIALSSSSGRCRFLTSAGALNFGLFSVASFGTVIAGPLSGAAGPVAAVHLLAGIAGTTLLNPAGNPGLIILLTLSLAGPSGATVNVPDGDSLTLWVQDDPTGVGAGTMQYWRGSFDERNLCSGYSFLYSGSIGAAFSFAPSLEWAIGFGTLDASMTTAITSLGGGPSGLNAHDSSQGFAPGFDAGAGSRTISITGTGGFGIGSAALGSEFVAFNVYDETGASNRLAVANVMGHDPTGPTCDARGATFVPAPTGGPGGAVLSTAIPERPRSVGKCDGLAHALLANPIWIAATNHATIAGGNNVPYFPAVALNGGSNAGGNAGGFVLPIPAFAGVVGVQLLFWNLNVDPTNRFIDPVARQGHKLSNGYAVLFFP